ncbi:MAG: DUF6178 family protein [Bacteriovoracales bacterium]|nr:DUF6178 family protein [Bacteriovoracales bacterium]
MTKKGDGFIKGFAEEEISPLDLGNLKALAKNGKIRELPLWPLSMAFRRIGPGETSSFLPALSKEQRKALLDFDLWNKDGIDVQGFSFWIEVYHKNSSFDLKGEFIAGEQCALYMKGVCGLSTFDEEDPLYPDHPHFFLTDDHLLLIEYDDSFPHGEKLQDLIRILYSKLGVEKAYAHLFKVTVDSFLLFQEKEYHLKKDRLADFGLIDYYEALEVLAPLTKMSHINQMIETRSPRKKEEGVGPLFSPSLPEQVVNSYGRDFDLIKIELDKIKDPSHINFLHHNFSKLINATLSAQNALKQRPKIIEEIGGQARTFLLLGLIYAKEKRDFEGKSVFDLFDFIDLYRIGKSIIHIKRILLKKSLRDHSFQGPKEKSFLGGIFQQLIEEVFIPEKVIKGKKDFDRLEEESKLLSDLLPFMASFYRSFKKMRNEGVLQNDYYLNYDVDDIDFEALILSSFINFDLGHYDLKEEALRNFKMGLSIQEIKGFAQKYGDEKGRLFKKSLDDSIQRFLISFGLEKMDNLSSYMHRLLRENLSGYNFLDMPQGDFAHVGGPVILKEELKRLLR